MSARVVASLACALVLASAGRASAEDDARARALTREALSLYRAGKYDQAIPRFEEAYARTSAPLLLYDIAQAYRLSGDCARAVTYYADYLRREPAAHNRGSVETKMAAMETCARTHRPAPPPVATSDPIVAEPPAKAAEPEVRPCRVAPAPPSVVPAVQPAANAALVRVPEQRTHRRAKRIGGLALMAAGVALVGVAAYFSAEAADRSQQVSHFFGMGGRWNDQLQSLEQDGRNATTASTALYPVAGALGAAGTALLVVSWKRER